jgi:hypothetical protein
MAQTEKIARLPERYIEVKVHHPQWNSGKPAEEAL